MPTHTDIHRPIKVTTDDHGTFSVLTFFDESLNTVTVYLPRNQTAEAMRIAFEATQGPTVEEQRQAFRDSLEAEAS